MLLLGIWHSLCNYGVEDFVNESLSASRFCGLGLADDVPNHSVLCRFRNRLNKPKVFDKLLIEINKQLNHKEVIVKTITKVDTSITNTPRKPKARRNKPLAKANNVISKLQKPVIW